MNKVAFVEFLLKRLELGGDCLRKTFVASLANLRKRQTSGGQLCLLLLALGWGSGPRAAATDTLSSDLGIALFKTRYAQLETSLAQARDSLKPNIRTQMDQALASYKAALEQLSSIQRLNRGELMRAYLEYDRGTQRFLALLSQYKSAANLEVERLARGFQGKVADPTASVLEKLYTACRAAGCSVASAEELQAKLKQSDAFNDLMTTLNDPQHSSEQTNAAMQRFGSEILADPALQNIFAGADAFQLHDAINNALGDLNLEVGASPLVESAMVADVLRSETPLAAAESLPPMNPDLLKESLQLKPKYEKIQLSAPPEPMPVAERSDFNLGSNQALIPPIPNLTAMALAPVDSGTEHSSQMTPSSTKVASSSEPKHESTAIPPVPAARNSESPKATHAANSPAAEKSAGSAPSDESSKSVVKNEPSAKPKSNPVVTPASAVPAVSSTRQYWQQKMDSIAQMGGSNTEAYRQAQQFRDQSLESENLVPMGDVAPVSGSSGPVLNASVTMADAEAQRKQSRTNATDDCTPFSHFKHGQLTAYDKKRASELLTLLSDTASIDVKDLRLPSHEKMKEVIFKADSANRARFFRRAAANLFQAVTRRKPMPVDQMIDRVGLLCRDDGTIDPGLEASLKSSIQKQTVQGQRIGPKLVDEVVRGYRDLVCGAFDQQILWLSSLQVDAKGNSRIEDRHISPMLNCTNLDGPARLMLAIEPMMRKAAQVCGVSEAFVWDDDGCRSEVEARLSTDRMDTFRNCYLDNIVQNHIRGARQISLNPNRVLTRAEVANLFASRPNAPGLLEWLEIDLSKTRQPLNPMVSNCKQIAKTYRFVNSAILSPAFGIQGIVLNTKMPDIDVPMSGVGHGQGW